MLPNQPIGTPKKSTFFFSHFVYKKSQNLHCCGCYGLWLERFSSHNRPYNHESTASRSLSEVKHGLAQLVLRWGTTLESWVLTFCSFLTLRNSNLMYYLFSKEPNIFNLIIIWDTLRNQSNYHHYLDHGMIFKLLFPHTLTNNTYKIKIRLK